MPPDDTLLLRRLASGDLEAAHALSRVVGWPHRLEDWRVMFGLGHGVAAHDRDGALRGVSLWFPQGADFATLGMVIVSPTLQKAGVGRRLMAAMMEAAGARAVQLNATVQGLRLYSSFGFVEVGGVHQHHGVLAASALPVTAGVEVRALVEADREAVLALDRRASGVDRRGVLEALLPLSRAYAVDGPDGLAGFLLARDFGRGGLLGPLVAADEAGALALLSRAATDRGGFLRADIPHDAPALTRWLEGAGLARVDEGRTMLRGTARPRQGPARVFGLAAQALG